MCRLAALKTRMTGDHGAAAELIEAIGAAGADTEATTLRPEEAVHRGQRIASRC